MRLQGADPSLLSTDYPTRMAMVASVYTVKPWARTAEQVVAGLRSAGLLKDGPGPRPKPEFKRVWASITNSPQEVIDEAFTEAVSRDPFKKKRWVVLVDGDSKQLRWVKKSARRHKVKVTIILDVIHVLEYLWRAGHVFHPDGTKEIEAWVAERFFKVLQGQAGIVAGGMRRSATLRGIHGKARERLDKAANYLKKYAKHLHYGEYLAAGLPIGTGVIEGACRSLVADRMDITGARWSLKGAEAVLRLRALRASNDFDAYWEFHREQEYLRNHGSAYAVGRHPPLVRPTQHSHLSVVK